MLGTQLVPKEVFCEPVACPTRSARNWFARYFVTPDVTTRAQCAQKQRAEPNKTTLLRASMEVAASLFSLGQIQKAIG